MEQAADIVLHKPSLIFRAPLSLALSLPMARDLAPLCNG
jgi:hypothetical protein